MKKLWRSIAALSCLLSGSAQAASTVWTCTGNAQIAIGPGGANQMYLATGECTSDAGTCDTSQVAMTSTQLCGAAGRTIRDVIVTSATVNGGASSGNAVVYDHVNGRMICLGSNGAAANPLGIFTAAMVTNTKFHYLSLCQ